MLFLCLRVILALSNIFDMSLTISKLQDGTWSTITGSCTVVRDLKDLLFHSYFSIMDDLRLQAPPNGKPYEIRSGSCLCLVLLYLSASKSQDFYVYA
jgi:hypothetical protein